MNKQQILQAQIKDAKEQLEYLKADITALEALRKREGNVPVCECCFAVRPSHDEGYSHCCNEPVYSIDEQIQERRWRKPQWRETIANAQRDLASLRHLED